MKYMLHTKLKHPLSSILYIYRSCERLLELFQALSVIRHGLSYNIILLQRDYKGLQPEVTEVTATGNSFTG